MTCPTGATHDPTIRALHPPLAHPPAPHPPPLAQSIPLIVCIPPCRCESAILSLPYNITYMTSADQISAMVRNWEKAIQEKNWEGILAFHHKQIVMFDVPPPFQSTGIDAYRQTWVEFFSVLEDGPTSFRVLDLQVVAGEDVAFCFSPMKCRYNDVKNGTMELAFRLTIGFKKIDGQWWFVHEHHSIPSVD